jgi:hypothetical protein
MKTSAKKFGNRYPWEKWLSPGRRVIHRGKDFDCRVHGMAGMIRNEICRRKLSGRVHILGDPPTCIRIEMNGHKESDARRYPGNSGRKD